MPGAAPVRVLIADDHPIFRDGLKRLLEAEEGFVVVGEAADGEQALALAERLAPDILLLDLAMPRMPGLVVLSALAQKSTPVRTILLTAAIERPEVIAALQAGAYGVVLKDSATELLFKCIRCVMQGQYWIGREGIGDLVAVLQQARRDADKAPGGRRFRLTRREQEVVVAIVGGLTNREIAGQMGVTEDTVKHHVTNVFDKLGVSNRLELAMFAIDHRLVER